MHRGNFRPAAAFLPHAQAWEVTPELRETRRAIAVARALLGPAGSDVRLRITGEDQRPRDVTLRRIRSTTHGAVNPAAFRKVSDRVGLLTIPIWAGKLEPQFDAAIAECNATCDALVIDLRGNVGGYVNLLAALAGKFLPADTTISEWRYRDRTAPLKAKESSEGFRGRVFVIIDEKSASSSELFAASLQDLRRATVVGTRSGGAVLPAETEKLPTGGSLLYPIADATRPNGERLEGRGVAPDVVLAPTRAALYAGRDIVLERTLALAEGR